LSLVITCTWHVVGFCHRIVKSQSECETQERRKTEGEEAKRSLLQKMDLHKETMQSREADLANIQKQLEVRGWVRGWVYVCSAPPTTHVLPPLDAAGLVQ
jgi:hypothetical protein